MLPLLRYLCAGAMILLNIAIIGVVIPALVNLHDDFTLMFALLMAGGLFAVDYIFITEFFNEGTE